VPGVPEAGAFRFSSKLEKKLVRKVGEAVSDFSMLQSGDRVMVCMSGGKDSYAMLDMLRLLLRRSPLRFEIIAVNIDQGWPGYRTELLEGWLKQAGVDHHMATALEIKTIVEAKLLPGQTPCVLCSRLRRGVVYALADKLGATKIALGHHLDDLIETLCLNLFFSGQLKAMPPKLLADDGRHVVIRPLAYALEDDLRQYAEARGYPVIACGCPSCGLPDQQRQVVKRMLHTMEESSPGLKHQMLAALKNVRASHLLDRALLSALGKNARPREAAADIG
jgi:tRNA 2-thiocytidine biosynthesis protein TtcA